LKRQDYFKVKERNGRSEPTYEGLKLANTY